jgi:hypothetical protein
MTEIKTYIGADEYIQVLIDARALIISLQTGASKEARDESQIVCRNIGRMLENVKGEN